MTIAILAKQPIMTEQHYDYHYAWYKKQPIPSPVSEGSLAAIPQLVLLPGRTINGNKRAKDYKRKIRLINEYGCLCAHCNNIKEVEELTLDHIHAKWMCSKENYNMKQNWQLLCRRCHNIKSDLEHSFLVEIVQKTIESVHLGIVNLSSIIQEYKEFVNKWNLRNRLSNPFLF